MPDTETIGQVHTLAQRIISALSAPYHLLGNELWVGVSIGLALAPKDGVDRLELMRKADIALYDAKNHGRGQFRQFEKAMDESLRTRQELAAELRQALVNFTGLAVWYQPLMEINGERVVGVEALLRWHHPTRGDISPADFIAIAEETGLIHMLGAFALYEACREASSWEGVQSVSVNLSPLQFKNSSLVSVVEGALTESGLDPARLEVEITESVLLDDSLGNIRTLQNLKALGVQIALDDFGTGYSSLSYLRSFPFDKIKIDKSFINDMGDSREALAIIRAITGMSRSLDIQITAEGVESNEQFAKLRDEGCTLFQGFLFGRPQPSELRLKTLD